MMAAAMEFTHAEDEDLSDRLENWGRAYRDRMTGTKILSLEGRYRSRGAKHWDYHELYGTAPDVRPMVDQNDAHTINLAWQAIPDAYHQAILGGHYVKKWSPSKCDRVARSLGGMEEKREMVREAEFAAKLDMGHRLLERQLTIPAVIRRARLAIRVRTALELEVWV